MRSYPFGERDFQMEGPSIYPTAQPQKDVSLNLSFQQLVVLDCMILICMPGSNPSPATYHASLHQYTPHGAVAAPPHLPLKS